MHAPGATGDAPVPAGGALTATRPGRAEPGHRAVSDAPCLAESGGWTIERHEVVDSTQALARLRPAWHAVVAVEQLGGRGQRERTFVSDRGGLYLSAVLPYAGDARRSRGFALAVGWALREAFVALGVPELRLRWPNDLMIGARKIGGILVEQGGPRTLVVGVGLNLCNRPWEREAALRGIAGSLEEQAPALAREAGRVQAAVLGALRAAQADFAAGGFAALVPRLNAAWGEAREVELELASDAASVRGRFVGVHESGDLLVAEPSGEVARIPEHHVARLREV